MNENDFLKLVRRWQDPGSWATVDALAANAADFATIADNLGADAKLILDRGDVAQAQTLKAESDHLRNCAADVRRQRAELAGQFMQIENWIREHRPELLEFVPIPKFDGDPSDAIRDLKRLESRIRKPAAETPSGPSGQLQNNVPQPTEVSEFYRLQKLPTWQGKPKAAIHREIAQRIAKKTKRLLKDDELRTESERIKKAIRDYERKANPRQ